MFLTRNLCKFIQNFNAPLKQIVRNSSYYSSQYLEDLGEINVKYKVTNDANEWKFVERALPLLIVPQPQKKDFYPSGWKPQSPNLDHMKYLVKRTKNHMIPVYLKIRHHGTRRHTIIKNIQGDIFLLEKELREFLQKETLRPIRSQANEFAGYIRINGDFVNASKYWLEKKEF